MKKDIQVTYDDSNAITIYTAEGVQNSFCLKGSTLDRGWTRHDEEYLRLTDNGNGISIKLFDIEKHIQLDYMQAELLRIALKINDPSPKLAELVPQKLSGLK